MNDFSLIAQRIIKEQENVIGPLAVEQAQKVPGLLVDTNVSTIGFNGDQKVILEHLVEVYRDLFGMASVEVCKEAAKDLIAKLPQGTVPSILQ